MTIKQQIEHACEYRYLIQIIQQGLEKPLIGGVQYCIARDNCLVLNDGRSDHHIDFEQIQNACIPVKSPGKLTLFCVDGRYFDNFINEYESYTNTSSVKRCIVCSKETGPKRYRSRTLEQSYCRDCVTVVNWTKLMGYYEKGNSR